MRFLRKLRLLPAALIFFIFGRISTQRWIPLRYSDCQNPDNGSGHLAGKKANLNVHILWVNGELSKLEKLSLSSFVKNGFSVNLWTYNLQIVSPEGVVVRDARHIIPEDKIFYSKSGSLAPFSDLFRYKLLIEEPGLWSDADVICLISADEFALFGSEPFLVSERLSVPRSLKLNPNIIFAPDSDNQEFIKIALSVSESLDSSKIGGLDLGPKLITVLFQSFPQIRVRVMKPNFANGIDPWDCPDALLRPNGKVPKGAVFIHCFNEIWRQRGIDKNEAYPKHSIMWNLEQKYLA